MSDNGGIDFLAFVPELACVNAILNVVLDLHTLSRWEAEIIERGDEPPEDWGHERFLGWTVEQKKEDVASIRNGLCAELVALLDSEPSFIEYPFEKGHFDEKAEHYEDACWRLQDKYAPRDLYVDLYVEDADREETA